MKRIATLAAVAMIAAPAAFAQESVVTEAPTTQMSAGLQQAINDAIVSCGIEIEDTTALTMAQATSIELADSEDQSQKCTEIRAIVE